MNVEVKGPWEKVKVSVDAATYKTVCRKNIASASAIKPTEASCNNINYVAANGTKIINHGQRDIKGVNDDWNKVGFAMQCADGKFHVSPSNCCCRQLRAL